MAIVPKSFGYPLLFFLRKLFEVFAIVFSSYRVAFLAPICYLCYTIENKMQKEFIEESHDRTIVHIRNH